MQVRHALFQLLLDVDHVVADAVVGAVGKRGHLHRAAFQIVRDELVLRYLLADGLLRKLGQTAGADDAPPVAPGDHVHRVGLGDDHGVVERLVAVAVHKGYIVAQHLAAPDDLVHGGGAVQHEIGVVRAENPGRVFLGLAHHAAVVQKRAQLRHGDGKVGPEGVFAEELVHGHPGRAAQKALAAHVPRGVPGVFVFLGVLDQLPEKAGKHFLYVFAQKLLHAPGQKLRGVGRLPEAFAYPGQNPGGDVFDGHAVGEQQNRDVRVPVAYLLQQTFGRHLLAGVLVLDVPVDDHRTQVGAGNQHLYGILVGE